MNERLELMEGHIRNIVLEKIEESLRLSQFAFQYEMSEEDRKARLASFKPEQNWGYYIDDQLAAKLGILKLQTWINGVSFEMGGIAGVATWPEYRRHGMVKKLLVHALLKMKEAEQTISFLHPFEFPFYRKFGWETYTEFRKYEIPKELIINQFFTAGHMKRTADWRLLDEIYKVYAQRFNGTLVRDENWWNRNVFKKSSTSAIFYDEAGLAKGYILYKVKNKEMNIEEFVFLDESARKGLWKFIADHDSMIDKIILKAPSNDQLAFVLANPRIKQEVVPYFMARIVDVAAFLEKFPIAAGLDKQRLELQITDEYAAWNNGSFTVKWGSSGKAKVKQNEADESKKSKDTNLVLACSIGTLSAMFLSYQRPVFLQSIGRLQASDATIELLEKLIPSRTTYLMDFF
jgi:predicted acetyltransferase